MRQDLAVDTGEQKADDADKQQAGEDQNVEQSRQNRHDIRHFYSPPYSTKMNMNSTMQAVAATTHMA